MTARQHVPRPPGARSARSRLVAVAIALGLTALACGGDDGSGAGIAALATSTTSPTPSASTGEPSTTADPSSTTSSSPSSTAPATPSTTSTTQPVPSTTAGPTPTGSTLPDGIEYEITDDGFGPVRLGMTVDEMIEALGPGYSVTFESAVRVDLDAYRVGRDGRTLFYAADLGEDHIRLLLTDNDRFGLASGLRPGMTLQEAVALHGRPTLGFNTESESRETVSFADGTGNSPRFRIETLIRAGIYADVVGGFNQTRDFRPEGRIGWLWLTCFASGPDACPE